MGQESLLPPLTQPVTIRLDKPDVAMAKHLSQAKGMPYQTYIRALLHEALEREAKTSPPVA